MMVYSLLQPDWIDEVSGSTKMFLIGETACFAWALLSRGLRVYGVLSYLSMVEGSGTVFL